MRAHIVLDDGLLREATRHSQARTKRALVHEALTTFARVMSAETRRAGYRERRLRLDSRVRGLSLRERPSEVLKSVRG